MYLVVSFMKFNELQFECNINTNIVQLVLDNQSWLAVIAIGEEKQRLICLKCFVPTTSENLSKSYANFNKYFSGTKADSVGYYDWCGIALPKW